MWVWIDAKRKQSERSIKLCISKLYVIFLNIHIYICILIKYFLNIDIILYILISFYRIKIIIPNKKKWLLILCNFNDRYIAPKKILDLIMALWVSLSKSLNLFLIFSWYFRITPMVLSVWPTSRKQRKIRKPTIWNSMKSLFSRDIK